MEQAREHSLAQLKLLDAAASRVRASDALLDSQVMTAAVAASMTKGGARLLDKLRKALLKLLE